MVKNIQLIFSDEDVKHGLSLFSPAEVSHIEKSIIKKGDLFFLKCLSRNKLIRAKPEEIVRQLFLQRLFNEFKYPHNRVTVEKLVVFGSKDSGFADIVVLRDDLVSPYIIFEIKRPNRSKGLEQLKSYSNTEGAPIAIWSNGNEMIRLHREDPNIYTEIPRIPSVTETINDILTERWTIDWLEEHDELRNGKTTLKKIILDLEELVLGDSGEAAFPEIFKLIYAKLYDESRGFSDDEYKLEFHVGDRSSSEVTTAIDHLLDGAKATWSGVFDDTEKIELKDEHLKVCVSFLEKIMLFHSNLRIIDEAFEYLIPQESKKKQGQFFTPRPVEDMVVEMLNPKSHEFIVDPACGSGGFLLHSVKWVARGTVSKKELPPKAKRFAQENIVGIDFARNAVKVSKAINLIIGDGKTHIYKDNSLNPKSWDDETKVGLKPRLMKFSDNKLTKENAKSWSNFNFDILMTNPPFAGTVKETSVLRLYSLSIRNGKKLSTIGRHILFIERSLQFVRPGGRLAIVLPQGILTNTETNYIRQFLIENARIMAVVGLHGNSFKPHTGTKTSVLFLQKHTEAEKQEINEFQVKFESDWEKFLTKLKKQYKDINWESKIDEDKIPKSLNYFIDTFFESNEEITEETKQDDTLETSILVNDISKLPNLIEEQEKNLDSATQSNIKSIKLEIKNFKKKLNASLKKISTITLGGQIDLILNNGKIQEQFKKLWIDEKLSIQIDYPIFFAVNEKPLKNNSGEYIYQHDQDGNLVLEDDYPIFEHDLDPITKSFITFAKKQGFDFH